MTAHALPMPRVPRISFGSPGDWGRWARENYAGFLELLWEACPRDGVERWIKRQEDRISGFPAGSSTVRYDKEATRGSLPDRRIPPRRRRARPHRKVGALIRPPFITLRLTDPPLKHRSVEWLQGLVNESKYVMPPLAIDGVFGPHTAHETKQALYRLGHPDPKPAIGPEGLAVLWAWHEEGARLPPMWAWRRLERKSKGFIKGWGITARSWAGLHPGAEPPPGSALKIISREAIGLIPPQRDLVPTSTPPSEGAVFHWNGIAAGAVGLEAAKAQFRAWQRLHMFEPSRNWSDIGYHFAVPRGCPVGTVFEGRGFGVWGAHAPGANDRLGVLLMSGSADGGPTGDQLATAQMFREAYARGRPTGHQEFVGTSCPGPAAMAWVRSKR